MSASTNPGGPVSPEPSDDATNHAQNDSPPPTWASLDLSSIVAAALSYRRLGLSPLRVHGTERDNGTVRCTCKKEDCTKNAGKHPVSKGWSKERLSESDVSEQFSGVTPWNVGVLFGVPSGGLTDVDHDCVEALALSASFLPTTDCVFGRASKPESHPLYSVIPAIKPAQFTDTDGKMLVEIRSTGGQTVMPPSIHQSGETITFSKMGTPATVDGAELRLCVAKLAAACIVLRGWPREKGGRWKRAHALAGGLLRAGWAVEDVKAFIRAIAEAAGDDEVEARVNSVDDTDRKLKNGEEVTGWTQLGELIGKAEVQLVCKYLGIKTSASKATRGAPAQCLGYRMDASGIVYPKPTQNGVVEMQLTTFTAEIVADVVEDDGAEKKRSFEVKASLRGGPPVQFCVPAGEFGNMRWAIEHLGPGAVIFPGFGAEAHARTAIQLLSPLHERRTVYCHTGWRKIDDQHVFLHVGGAIGPNGPVAGVQTRLEGSLAKFLLPEPPGREELVTAIQASLRLAELAPPEVAVPAYASIWRAILGESDQGVFTAGPTGAFKSEHAALHQQHFGAEMDRLHLPGSWLSTDNALEDSLFRAKDVLFVIDDFKPSGNAGEDAKLHARADRVFRGTGNSAGRGRMRADTSLRPPRPPRALPMGTGEDLPRGHSMRARVLCLELDHGDIDPKKLTACQRDGAAGKYAQVTASFVRWMAGQYEQVRASHRRRTLELRDELSGSHRRTSANTAALLAALELFLKFVLETTGEEALTAAEARSLMDAWRAAMVKAAKAQSGVQDDADSAKRYIVLLGSAITSGKAHLTNPDGTVPIGPERWGWREEFVGKNREWKPRGDHIGWVDDEYTYLDPPAAYRAAQSMCGPMDGLPVSETRLRKLMKTAGMLALMEERREKLLFRVTLQGSRREVLAIRTSLLRPNSDEPAQSAQSDLEDLP